jgi:hypothetical protein
MIRRINTVLSTVNLALSNRCRCVADHQPVEVTLLAQPQYIYKDGLPNPQCKGDRKLWLKGKSSPTTPGARNGSPVVQPTTWPLYRLVLTFERNILFNHLTPNGHFSGRTAPLTYRCCIFYLINRYTYRIFETCCKLSVFSSSKCLLFHNATFFGSCIIRILNTGCAKI